MLSDRKVKATSVPLLDDQLESKQSTKSGLVPKKLLLVVLIGGLVALVTQSYFS